VRRFGFGLLGSWASWPVWALSLDLYLLDDDWCFEGFF
jgi:hypothetical protein